MLAAAGLPNLQDGLGTALGRALAGWPGVEGPRLSGAEQGRGYQRQSSPMSRQRMQRRLRPGLRWSWNHMCGRART